MNKDNRGGEFFVNNISIGENCNPPNKNMHKFSKKCRKPLTNQPLRVIIIASDSDTNR